MKDPNDQLDDLLRDVEVPVDLKYRLHRIASETADPPPVRRSSTTSRRWMAYPALMLAASVLGVGLFLWPTRDAPLESAKTPDPPTNLENGSMNSQPHSVVDEILAQQAAVELELIKLKTLQLKAQLRAKRPSATPGIGHAEKMAIVLTMASQSSLEQGNDVEHVRQDLNYVLKTYPDTAGAARAKQILIEY